MCRVSVYFPRCLTGRLCVKPAVPFLSFVENMPVIHTIDKAMVDRLVIMSERNQAAIVTVLCDSVQPFQ